MSRLAINGGDALRKKPFQPWPCFDEKEVQAVTKVVLSGKWGRFEYSEGVERKELKTGPNRSQQAFFQEEFAKYQEGRYAVAMANGTGALEVALKALGVGPGDEVIVPAYTYVGSSTCVLQVNAVPVFVDVDAGTFNIDPAKFEEAITDRTKAVIVVHFGGQPADMDRICEIAKKHNIFVVEDSAHAHGSEWKGRRVGAIGDIGTFSFQSAKTVTSGEGGLILTNDESLYTLCDSYVCTGRNYGRPWYEFYRLGWNYRITEFQAAILRIQLTRLDEQIAKRMENAGHLTKLLSEIPGITPATVDERVTRHGNSLYLLKYDRKEFGNIPKINFTKALMAEGILGFWGYEFPLYKNPMYLEKNFYSDGSAKCPIGCKFYETDIDYGKFEEKCPVSERLCRDEAVWLDQRMLLGTAGDVEDVVKAIRKIRENIPELKKRFI